MRLVTVVEDANRHKELGGCSPALLILLVFLAGITAALRISDSGPSFVFPGLVLTGLVAIVFIALTLLDNSRNRALNKQANADLYKHYFDVMKATVDDPENEKAMKELSKLVRSLLTKGVISIRDVNNNVEFLVGLNERFHGVITTTYKPLERMFGKPNFWEIKYSKN